MILRLAITYRARVRERLRLGSLTLTLAGHQLHNVTPCYHITAVNLGPPLGGFPILSSIIENVAR